MAARPIILPLAQRRFVQLAAVLGITALLLLPMLWIGFINDDVAYISLFFRDNAPDPLRLLTSAGVTEDYYRPLSELSSAVDVWLWGWNPTGFRLTNLLLHLAATGLVFRLAMQWFGGSFLPFAAALFFGLLPVHETSILWIPGRTDLLCAVFYLGSVSNLTEYATSNNLRNQMAALGLFLLALLSKEMAFSLPLVLVPVLWWVGRNQGRQWRFQQTLRTITPFLLLAAGVVAARWLLLDNNILFGGNGPHTEGNILQIARNMAMFLAALIIPAGLYQLEELLAAYPLAVAGTGMALAAAALWFAWRNRRLLIPLVLPAAWVLLALLPVSRLMMRWYLYIPSVGFCIGLAWAMQWLCRNRPRLRTAMVAAVALLYAGILAATIGQWIAASNVAERLVSQLRSELRIGSGADTIYVASSLARIQTVPVFHLGFQKTLQQAFGNDSLVVGTWGRFVAERYPSRINYRYDSATGSVHLSAESGGYFLLMNKIVQGDNNQAMVEVKTDAGNATMMIDSLSASHKPTEITIAPQRPARRHLVLFNGTQFLVLQP
ncbi:MAG: hypothetical protein IT211_03290 [Armatimonadetes bacterium]|nr:hypothetical protein [Armatimonadota bacterium]